MRQRRLKLKKGENREGRGKMSWIPENNSTMLETVSFLWQNIIHPAVVGMG